LKIFVILCIEQAQTLYFFCSSSIFSFDIYPPYSLCICSVLSSFAITSSAAAATSKSK
jgi:hypothetical protein